MPKSNVTSYGPKKAYFRSAIPIEVVQAFGIDNECVLLWSYVVDHIDIKIINKHGVILNVR